MPYKRKILFWLLQIFYWSLYFIYSIQFVHNYEYYLRNAIPSHLLVYLFFFCYMGIPFSLILRFTYNKIRARSNSLPLLIITIVAGSILLAHLWFLEVIILDNIVEYLGHRVHPYTWQYYGWEIFSASMLLVGWSSLYLLIKFWEEWNEQKSISENAVLLAENAQLKMLRYQLNPHFLFNSLGSLRALIREDQDRAINMVTKMSEYMRYSLLSKSHTKVPLDEELEAIRNYLEIEKVRFDDKIEILYNINQRARKFLVPGFILHPVVENALKYGMQTSPFPLVININVTLYKSKLIVEIINSGSWCISKDNSMGTGTGLQNVQNRLKVTYPKTHKFKIDKLKGTVRVLIEIENDEE